MNSLKMWLTKLRISNALDDGKPLPPDVARAVAQSPELRRFAENVGIADESLKEAHSAAAPDSLHAAIMFAVRSAQAAGARTRQPLRRHLTPASAVGLLILLCLGVFVASHFSHSPAADPNSAVPSSLSLASTTLETGRDWVHTMPSAALAPLNDEMLRLNRDLTNAQNYLLASLP